VRGVACYYSLDDQLVDAIFLSDADDARDLLVQGADPDARDEERRPALTLAVADGGPKLVRLLLEAGADPNLRDGDGLTALDVAVYRRRLDLVWMLLRFGADANTCDEQGVSTLWRASLVSNEDPRIYELLWREGAGSERPCVDAN
jgi:ankyrin repeat protein